MRSYRCFLTRSFEIADTGVREWIQLRARDAVDAACLALAVSGANSVVDVIRIEETDHA